MQRRVRWLFWMTAKVDGVLDMVYQKPLAPDGPNTRWVLTEEGGGLSSWGLRP